MLWQALASVRDLGRLHDIASVLVRYGFGDLVQRFGLADALEDAGRALHWGGTHELIHLSPPAVAARARGARAHLVKLGQVLATRVDLFEPEWIAEFGRLQDSAPPVPYEALLPQLVEDLGGPPEQVFAHLSASCWRRHRSRRCIARLADGNESWSRCAGPASGRWSRPTCAGCCGWRSWPSPEPRAAHLQPAAGGAPVRPVAAQRARLQHRVPQRGPHRGAVRGLFRRRRQPPRESGGDLLQPPPLIVVPRVHWDWSGERVCVQDYIAGIPGRRLAELDAAGLDRKVLARWRAPCSR